MRLGALFSGGKDSTLAILKAREEHKISCLISINPENKESYMFHAHNISLTKIQAKAMEVPIIIQNSSGEKERELSDLKNAIKKAMEIYKIDGVVSGAINSVYQASRIQKICNELEIFSFNPLWLKNSFNILKEIVKKGIGAIVIGAYAYPLGKEFLGKEIDNEFIKKIKALNEKYKIHPLGEGGEYETFVYDAPFFNSKIEIKNYNISGKENSWRMEILRVEMREKLQ